MIITTMDSCSSIIAGCITFGILGNLAFKTGAADVASVVKGGAGLAFISYPDAIAKFEFIPQVRIDVHQRPNGALKQNYLKGVRGTFLSHAIRIRHRQHGRHGLLHCACDT